MSAEFVQLQEDITNMLLACPKTQIVPYSNFRSQTIQTAADEASAAWKVRVPGKVGLACMVMMPAARIVDPDVPGPQFEVTLTIRTFEDPKVNNTGLTAEGVAIENMRWLDGWMIEDLVQEIHGDKNDEAIQPNYNYPGMLVYDSKLAAPLPQSHDGRSFPPTIADDGVGTVTLAVADPSCLIYFTTDGSCPSPGNPAQQYAAPFLVTDRTIVRFLAWNMQNLPSAVGKGRVLYS